MKLSLPKVDGQSLYSVMYICHFVSPFVMLNCIFLMFLSMYKLGVLKKLKIESVNQITQERCSAKTNLRVISTRVDKYLLSLQWYMEIALQKFYESCYG